MSTRSLTRERNDPGNSFLMRLFRYIMIHIASTQSLPFINIHSNMILVRNYFLNFNNFAIFNITFDRTCYRTLMLTIIIQTVFCKSKLAIFKQLHINIPVTCNFIILCFFNDINDIFLYFPYNTRNI